MRWPKNKVPALNVFTDNSITIFPKPVAELCAGVFTQCESNGIVLNKAERVFGCYFAYRSCSTLLYLRKLIMSRKSLVSSVVFFFCCFFSVQLIAETLTMGSALNKAGRQRMLTQNIMKNYMLLGLDVDVTRSRKELDKSVALFEEQFQELSDYAPTETVKRSLSKVEDLWFPYRSIAIGDVNKEGAAKLLDSNLALLKACHQVVMDLEAYAGRNSAKMVNTSGRQRMLSQRIAAHYFAHAWGFRGNDVVQAFETAKKEYGQGLVTLVGFNQNTSEIRQSLKKVQAQWDFSNTGFEQLDAGNYVPHVISVTTTGMLKRMNNITHLYENLDVSLSTNAVASTMEP